MGNVFICGQKNHECNSDGIPVLQLKDGREVPDTPENNEKYYNPTDPPEKWQVVGGSVTCSICGRSAISQAYWL